MARQLPAPADPAPAPAALERAAACARIAKMAEAGQAPRAAIAALRETDPGLPSAATLYRWWRAWREGGSPALVPRRRGRVRKPYGWEDRAARLYGSPTRPLPATVARWLVEEGFEGVTASRVRRYLRSLPARVGGADSPARAGRHHWRQNHGPYVERDETVLDVGLVYEGDGHRCDVYVRHPMTGNPFRPELVVWLDVRSHYAAGWWLAEDESAVSTLYSLSKAVVSENHVPAAVHVDPGSGFINKLLCDESVGWLRRLDIDVIPTLPGNAKGKGLIEGWFHWFEERCGKRFPSYMQRRTDLELHRLETALRAGRIELPTLGQYAGAVQAYVASYNRTPQRRLGATPAELWQGLARSEVALPAAALVRPCKLCTVRRGRVQLYGRVYSAPALLDLAGRRVGVEYDLADDGAVWVDAGGRRLVEARLVEARPHQQPSRIADLREGRLRGQLRRIERKQQEVIARAQPAIDVLAAGHQLAPAARRVVGGEPLAPDDGDDALALAADERLRRWRNSWDEEGI